MRFFQLTVIITAPPFKAGYCNYKWRIKMVAPIKQHNGWLAFNCLAIAGRLLYNSFWTSGTEATKIEEAAKAVLAAQQTEPASTALVLRNVIPTPKSAAATGVVLAAGKAATTAGVLQLGAPAVTVPLLGAPFAAASAGGAAGAGAAAAGEGVFASMYGAASGAAETAAKFAWSYLPGGTTLALGGLGVLGLAYLANKYWRSSGVTINNNFNPTVNTTVNLKFEGLPAGTKVVQTKDEDGTVNVTVEQEKDIKLAEVVRKVLAEIRAQKAAEAAAAA